MVTTTTSLSTLNRVRYVGLDFDTHFDDLRARLQVEFAEDFNDFALSSLGIMLLDLVAYGLDSLSFYLDRRASDAYLTTARTRKGVTRLSDQLGYKIGASVAASVDLKVAVKTAVAFDVPMPKGFQFSGPNSLVFETAEAVTFPAGSGPTNFKVVPCYQGVTVTENFVSDGSVNQVFQLQRVPDQSFVVQGTVGVLVNAAVWAESDFISFDKTNQFAVGYGDDPPTLSFGDGIAGNVPTSGAAITVTYVASRGKSGQVASGSISKATNQLVVNFTNIPLVVVQAEASVGGDDTESLAKVKRLAGKVFKSRKVAVTAEDYRALAGSFADPFYGRIASAQAVSSRSAADDLFLNNTITDIDLLIAPVKSAVNTSTASERTSFNALLGELNIVGTQTSSIIINDQDANTALNAGLVSARAGKNSVVEMYNDAGDVVTEATLGGADVSSMPVATANLAIGVASSRVLYIANVPGQVGTAVRIQHLAGGTLSVAVVNKDITVTVAPASTAAQVAGAVNGDFVASGLVQAYACGDGSGTATTTVFLQSLAYSGGTVPAISLPLSGLQDTQQALLQQRLDRCKTEATNIQTGTAALQGSFDNIIIPKMLEAQTKVLDSGISSVTPGTKVYTVLQAVTAGNALVGTPLFPYSGLYALSYAIDTSVLVLDTTLSVTSPPTTLGGYMKNIYDHVDALLAADCQSNLVTVPVLARNAAGFYAGPSLGLQQALQAYLDGRKEVTQTVKVTSGENYLRRPVIALRVGVLLGYSESVVRAAVETVVDGVLRDRDFGVALYVSDLDCEVRDNVAGVGFVNVVISGWNDSAGAFQTSELDADGNLIILSSEVITKETRTGLPSVTVTTEIVTG